MNPSPLSVGDDVKIKEGVYAGMVAKVTEVVDLEFAVRVRVETDVLGRKISVELEYWQVEGI